MQSQQVSLLFLSVLRFFYIIFSSDYEICSLILIIVLGYFTVHSYVQAPQVSLIYSLATLALITISFS